MDRIEEPSGHPSGSAVQEITLLTTGQVSGKMVGTDQEVGAMSREVVTQIARRDGVLPTSSVSSGPGAVDAPPCPVRRRPRYSSADNTGYGRTRHCVRLSPSLSPPTLSPGVNTRVPAQVRMLALGVRSSSQTEKGGIHEEVRALCVRTDAHAGGSRDCSLPGRRSTEVRPSLEALRGGGGRSPIQRNQRAVSQPLDGASMPTVTPTPPNPMKGT